MRSLVPLVLCVLLLQSAGIIQAASERPTNSGGGKLNSLPVAPLRFERNVADPDSGALFQARGLGYGIFFFKNEVMLALGGEGGAPAWVRLSFEGSIPPKEVVAERPTGGKSHYFQGFGSTARSAPHFGHLRYRGIYPGVDLVFYGTDGELEFDFVVAPGADFELIRMRYDGVRDLAVDDRGGLRLDTPNGVLRQGAPTVFQMVAGRSVPVESRYVLRGRTVGLKVGRHREDLPLVIDPVLTYSTLYGGGGSDQVEGVAIDADGNVYLTGSTTSLNLPVAGGLQPDAGGSTDTFVVKLNAAGDQVVYATYLGGALWDYAADIAVDSDGYVYVTGTSTSVDFPVTVADIGGCCGVFVAKISPEGDALAYSTFVGQGEAGGIAVDGAGAVFVTGWAISSFPTTAGALQTICCRGYDGFVAKLSPDGRQLSFSTLLGGTASDRLTDIALGPEGGVFVTGYTYSSDFPVTAGAVRPYYSGGWDAIVARLLPDGSGLSYATFAGGGQFDFANSIAVSSSGVAYVAGETESRDFPTAGNAIWASPVGSGLYGFVFALNPLGTAFSYSTFLPGPVVQNETHVALAPDGSAFVTGATKNAGFPITADAEQPVLAGSYDIFLSHLTADGSSLLYSTLLGGTGVEHAGGLASNATGALAIAGRTGSADFPVTAEAAQQQYAGGGDSFVAVLSNGQGACSYELTEQELQIPAQEYSGTVGITTGLGCEWTATSADGWISIQQGASGAGSGVVYFLVEANAGEAREGRILAGGQEFVVRQEADLGGCSFTLNPAFTSLPQPGGNGSFDVIASLTDCQWTAAESLSWVTLNGQVSGTGNGTVQYTVAANNSYDKRSGTVQVGGAVHEVRQESRLLKAVMTSPDDGSNLIGSTQLFVWAPGEGSSRYYLHIGSEAGGGDLYKADQGTMTSATVSGLPVDGRIIYVRLWSLVGSDWDFSDTSYVSGQGTIPGAAVMLSPASGSTLAGSTQEFQWSSGAGASGYWLDVGTVSGAGDIFSQYLGINNSVTVQGLPVNGGLIYARLWSLIDGGWVPRDYTYQAAGAGSSTPAALVSPAPHTTLPGPEQTFVWNMGEGVSYYHLTVGSSPGSGDILNQYAGTATSLTVSSIPQDGRIIYVRLWSRIGDGWHWRDYIFRASLNDA